MSGKLIVIEGLDGSGKDTQTKILLETLSNHNILFRKISFPDYSDASSTLVKMYLGGDFGKSPSDVNAYAASTFYAVDRYASFLRHWRDDYNNGKLIIADRYTTSNAVHQTCKLPKNEWDKYLAWLYDFEYNLLGLPRPDLVLYLDMPPLISQKLISKRYNGDESKKDIHERDTLYLTECRKSALYAALHLGWKIISCAENGSVFTIDEISFKIANIVLSIL